MPIFTSCLTVSGWQLLSGCCWMTACPEKKGVLWRYLLSTGSIWMWL